MPPRMLSERPDDEIIAASKEDPQLFVGIFDRHGRAIHSYVVRRAGSQVADDLISDIWLQSFRSRERYNRGCADARPWLYGIAKNVLRAHWRVHHGAETAALEPPPHDVWADVDDRIDAGDRAAMVKRALGELEPDDREVLLLVAWEELTPTQAASVLGIPAGTARWRLHRARAHLRWRLVEGIGEPALGRSRSYG